MRKKTIAWLFIIGIILAAVGGAMYGAAFASAFSVAADGTTTFNGYPPTFGIGVALSGIGGLLTTISWVGALVATGKQSRWGWFICIFLLSPIAELIYLFAGPGL